MINNQKVLVVCGPTGVGKTSLAIRLAKKFDGEIISADSRQVYIGMDIGTGKDLPVNSKLKTQNSKLGYYLIDGIPVWMVDVVTPAQEFSVAQYVDLAWKAIEDIWNRKKLPIMVGGTGFYIKAIVDGIETMGVPPDWELREKLRYYDTKILRETLEKLDPEKLRRMNESDRKNPRRLIRAIELATKTVRPISARKPYTLNPLFIGLTAPYKTLYQQIDERVDERVKQGVEKEIEGLLKMGYSWDNSVLGITIGYREWQLYFEKKTTKEEVVKKWKFAEHGYARRQMTWFKRDKRINWFDVTSPSVEEKIEKMVSKCYNLG